MSDSVKILNWFYRNDFPQGVLDFDSILIDAVNHALSKSRIDSESFAESNKQRLWNYLNSSIQRDQQRGIQPVFRIVSGQARRFIWYPIDLTTAQSNSERAKFIMLRSRPTLLRSIDGLTNRQYEALGCVISRLVGAENVSLTRTGNEGGVDFFALIRVHGTAHVFTGSSSYIRVIGQCKKYTTAVQVDKIKEFLTTVNDVKGNRDSVRPHIPSWFYMSRGPIVGWVIAHSGFQSGAETRARSEGVLLSDSIDLAQMAAMSRNLTRESTPVQRANKLKSMIDSVIQEFAL